MRIPRSNSTRKAGISMTPMIDVVFLLIIFFLVSSHLARQESSLELELPVASSASDDTDQTTPRLIVNVTAAGELSLAGRAIEAGQLKARFAEARKEEGDGVEVRIRGSRAASYGYVEPIMRACTEAGIWNVTYAVYREAQR